MIRIGIFGNSENNQCLIELIHQTEDVVLSGIFSGKMNYSSNISLTDQPANIFLKEKDLIEASDAILFTRFSKNDIPFLFDALKNSKHVFIHPEFNLSEELLRKIQKLGDEAGVLYYLRHNVISKELQKSMNEEYSQPEFLDIYRYIPTHIEYTEEDVQTIMSREILFIMSLNKEEIKKHTIKTVPYNSCCPYIINIRFEFSNSSTSNLTINFYTHDNSRYSEVYFNKRLIRINSDPGVVEYLNREAGNFKTGKGYYNLREEQNPLEEVNTFFSYLKESKYPLSLSSSGLAAHKAISSLVEYIKNGSYPLINQK